ncbi:MAG: GntR family transcriptional regulator [Burkholderiaceae bacterium]|nr:MAG: GntR family transcriptional regulator [Burkholderiaceae bacterium]MCC7284967.1 GntR family transcriptional regulator [Burkholderiaceae bacterium]
MVAGNVSSIDRSGRRPGRQSDDAFDILRQAILRCELTPGALVSEAELAARFHLRRAATRVALERLSMFRLLRPVPRRGYVVKPITLRDVHDLFQLRTIVEIAAVRLAAGRVDEEGLRRLDRVCTAGYRPGDRASEAEFLRANSEFHTMVAAASGNDRLVAMVAQLLAEMERLFHFGLSQRDRTQEMQQEHQALIDALARGDADAAERMTREELSSSKAMVLDALISSESLLDVSISRGDAPRD